jgi:hypothetical protein
MAHTHNGTHVIHTHTPQRRVRPRVLGDPLDASAPAMHNGCSERGCTARGCARTHGTLGRTCLGFRVQGSGFRHLGNDVDGTAANARDEGLLLRLHHNPAHPRPHATHNRVPVSSLLQGHARTPQTRAAQHSHRKRALESFLSPLSTSFLPTVIVAPGSSTRGASPSRLSSPVCRSGTSHSAPVEMAL